MTVPDGVLQLIEAAVPGVTVYDAGVPEEPPERYAVYWPDDGSRALGSQNMRVAVQSTGERFTWQVSSVGPDRQMAAWIAKRIRDTITDVTPVVEGYSCGPIQHQFSVSPDREEQVLSRQSVLMADRYELLAERLDEPGS
jgi:hypothetical protein